MDALHRVEAFFTDGVLAARNELDAFGGFDEVGGSVPRRGVLGMGWINRV